LLRKVVLWFLIGLIIAFSFATQLGSVATFAGLLTAGVAVALQNVILSIAGYFFLIGRFGIRVGDRVQIAGVNGEVVDIGLVRLHLMELSGGTGTPTGRVVAFSNSMVFQPTAGLFKQIPGTSLVWHEITITLSADSDYHMVEKRLLEVVEAVFADYRDDIERQRRQLERTLTYGPSDVLLPRSRLRITQSGLEAVIRFPVTLQNAAEIDDRVTRELLKAINREPKLKLVGSGTPNMRLDTDVSAPSAAR
jgi:small-conductance mechanosensitive channel